MPTMKTLLGLAPLFPIVLAAAIAGCGGNVDCEGEGCANAANAGGGTPSSSTSGPGGAGGQGGAGAQGGAGGQSGECAIDPPGATFTFHVHNAGASMLWLARGCGGTIPIAVDTADGPQGIGPGSGDFCEVACESVYQGNPNNGCSDCGPGVYDELAAGATVDIAWDRRVYISHMAPEACSGTIGDTSCALGLSVDPSAMQTGQLVACSEMGFGGGCATQSQIAVSFTVDTEKSEATVEVK